MPEKRSRRERRRTAQRTSGGPAPAARRPRPAPGPSAAPADAVQTEEAATSGPAAAPVAPRSQVATRLPGASPSRAERRAGPSAARLLEAQREERVQQEAIRDLRRIGITAGIVLVLLALAAFLTH